jgi:hypothetical protein
MEDLHRLRQAQDAPEQRDLLAAQSARLAAAVPMLVERADRLGGLGVESQHVGDLRSAVAPCLHQRARHLALALDGQQPAGAGAHRAARGDRPQRPHESREPARPVHALRRALRHVIVRAEQGRHPGRVRRATGVLEQQRVEQVRARRRIKLQLLRQPHADLAAPHRVAGRLSLGEVERVREPGDHPGQRDLGRSPVHPSSIPPSAGARTCS